MRSAVVLLSGGIDSATLLHYVRTTQNTADLYALSFHYGQRHSCELDAAAAQARKAGVREHRILDISGYGALTGNASVLTHPSADIPPLQAIAANERQQPLTYVPNRNMILLALAAAYAEAHHMIDVYYGAQAQDEYGYWDCTTDFLNRMNHVLALNRRQAVIIHAPFVAKRKAEVLRIGLDLGVDYALTWTCYRGGDAPCGKCPSCVERANAFQELDRPDPLA